MLFCDGQFSFQPRTQIVNRYGHWAIFVFSTYNYTGSSLYFVALYTLFHPEVGIPQFEAQSASCATFARAEVAKRFNKLFLAIAQVALRFKENKSFLRFIALRTEKIYNSVRIMALRTEKNLVACALLRCALSKVEILRCALSD